MDCSRRGPALFIAGLFVISACESIAQSSTPLWSHIANGQEISFSPDSSLLATGGGGVNIWHARDGSLFESLKARFNDANSVAFSPNGKYLADGVHAFNQNLNMWLVADGSIVKERMTAHSNGTEAVRFSPNGQYLASAGRDGYTKLWSVPDLTLVRSFPTGKRTFSVAFSPDGSRIVAGAQNGVSVWDVASGTLIEWLNKEYVESVAYSPDGTLIAAGQSSAESAVVWIWRTSDGILLETLSAPDTLSVISIAFSPDGRVLAAGGDGGGYQTYHGNLRFWRVQDGKLLQDIIFPDDEGTGMTAVMTVAYSPDGKLFAYGQLNNLVTVIRNPFPGPSGP